MVKYTEEANAVIQKAGDFARNTLKHSLVHNLHILWAIYHHEPTLAILGWLKVEGVNEDMVRAEFAKSDFWTGVDDDNTSEAFADDANGDEIGLSPQFQKFMEMTALMSNNGVVDTIDIVRGMLTQGENKAYLLLARCSGNKLQPIDVGVPSASSINASARQLRESVTYAPVVVDEPSNLRTNEPNSGNMPGKEGKDYMPVDTDESVFMDAKSKDSSLKSAIRDTKYSAINDGSGLPSNVTKSQPPGGISDSTGGKSTRGLVKFVNNTNGQSNARRNPGTGKALRGTLLSVASQKSFLPTRLVDIDKGTSFQVRSEKFLDTNNRVKKLDKTGAVIVDRNQDAPFTRSNTVFFGSNTHKMNAMETKHATLTKTNNQVGMLGGAWRSVLKTILVNSSDEVNNLMYTRTMQLFLPFMTGYESYILAGLIEAYDQNDKIRINKMLSISFQNRNISRVLVQQMSRFDILWHWSTQIGHNRTFDKLGRIPIVGFGSFPPSENAIDTRTHARNSILRVVLGKGNWLTRFVTGREGLQTDDKDAAAQNLAAETSGFEAANRNQFGTFFGRQKTNEFRAQHRLPTDESLVRTFVNSPGPTMVNNGIEHTLRALAKHWHNMNYQPSGNFAHQRMEQINAFEIMRFHMPVVFVTLTVHRGLNRWDADVLSKFIRKLQLIEPAEDTEYINDLIDDCLHTIVDNVCGGIKARADALRDWLQAIKNSLVQFEETAKEVYNIVSSVEIGLRLGHDMISSIDWRVPSNKVLSKAVIDHISHKKVNDKKVNDIDPFIVQRALILLAPRDKRTMIELIKDGKVKSKPADLLLRRTTTLLQREIRRDAINTVIKSLSKGDHISTFQKRENYWIEDEDGTARIYYYAGKKTGVQEHKFVDKLTGYERWIDSSTTSLIQTYIPVAESITRVQKAYMNIECDYGTKFTLNGLMEFSYLRKPLRNMIVLSQITCEALDDARLNVLKDIQNSQLTSIALRDLVPGRLYYVYESERSQYEPLHCDRVYTEDDEDWEIMAKKAIVTVPPQSMIVIGGGPTGLVTTIHNLENVLTSGGTMRLYEARDSFTKGGATFERAQIVRLDARWIAMMRYHLGTIFEEVFYPATGETDSHRGNTLPTQGFVEITIKDLEAMLHEEVCRLLSSGLLQHDTNSGTNYDLKTNTLQKAGSSLKKDDLIFHQVDNNGNKTKDKMYSWKVTDLEYNETLRPDELTLGEEYSIYVYKDQKIHTFRLISIDIDKEVVSFKAMDDDISNLENIPYQSLPTVYRKTVDHHSDIKKVFLECVTHADDFSHARDELDYKEIEKEKFALDIQNTHVVEATGKQAVSKVHFRATTSEPYGVCCISGLKISLGMHNFGSKRWGEGIIDDIRSQSDQNTRIIGDFTKNVKTSLIAERMHSFFTRHEDDNWRKHFATFVSDSGFDIGDEIGPLLADALKEYAKIGQDCRRPFLQTRFFETGDFFYIGMEFTREYDSWKNAFTDDIFTKIERRLGNKDDIDPRKKGRFKGGLNNNIDRLWFDATLESIRLGDVYNPGARWRVPHLYLIDSSTKSELRSLPVGEAFIVDAGRSHHRYEVVLKEGDIICRNVEGYLKNFDARTLVRRAGNLARGPDGVAESKVALATFPVAHYVNFRGMRLNNIDNGYSFAFIGDEQSTPHFMRYSGLTGACINGYLFNKFIGRAVAGIPYIDRAREYMAETNWSNGEVVTRGTGANYGVDGFLRPGFGYAHGLDYLRSKLIEHYEFDQDFDEFLSRDWKIKFAAAWVPIRLEMDNNFMENIQSILKKTIHEQFISEISKDDDLSDKPHEVLLKKIFGEIEDSSNGPIVAADFWNEVIEKLGNTDQRVIDYHVPLAMLLEQAVDDILNFARQYYFENKRVSSEYEHQPKSVDFISDDFAVQAQNFTASLTFSATLSAAALTILLLENTVNGNNNNGIVGSAILSAITPLIAFGTVTNASQYKTRNEMSREEYRDKRYLPFLQEVFSCMKSVDQAGVSLVENPFYREIYALRTKFINDCRYYNLKASGEFNQKKYEPTAFTNAFRTFAISPCDDTLAAEFLLLIQTKLLPSVFHENSYIQQTLTDLTVVLKRLIEYNKRKYHVTEEASKSAKILFERVVLLEPRLDGSLQRGDVKWGFFKSRKLMHGHCWTSLVQYWWDKIYCARPGKIPRSVQEARGRGDNKMRPISAETIEIKAQTEALIVQLTPSETGGLKRSIQDLQQFYNATKESYTASLIVVSGTISFFTGILFTIANIGNNASNMNNRGFYNLSRVGMWSFGLITPITAILSMLHLFRKFWILWGLSGKLSVKLSKGGNDEAKENIKTIKSVTRSQQTVTLMRFIASAGSAVALYTGLAALNMTNTNFGQAPFWIGLGSLCLHVLSVVYLLFIEYFIRYKFDPRLGEYLSESFREEIAELHNAFSMKLTNINTNQEQELNTWEYVAREFLHDHRFDTVFAADRFSALFNFLQSGLSGIASTVEKVDA